MSEISRRNMLRDSIATGLEALAGLGVVAKGVANAITHHDYAVIDSSRAVSAENRFPELSSFEGRLEHVCHALSTLASCYELAYEKTRLVPKTWIDSEGDVHFTIERQKYWDEEQNVAKHEVIDQLEAQVGSYVDQIKQLKDPTLIDRAKVSELLVETRSTSGVFQAGSSAVLYGAALAGLMGYEEALGLRESYGDQARQDAESKEQYRRGFIKVIALGAGLVTAGGVGRKIDARLEHGRTNLERVIDTAKTQAELVSASAFRGYFQNSPEAMIGEIARIRHGFERSLQLGVGDRGVREAMKSVVKRCQTCEEEMKKMFADGVPQGLGDLCAGAIITKTISDARNTESFTGGAAVVVDGLAVGGAMAATVVALELVNQRISASGD